MSLALKSGKSIRRELKRVARHELGGAAGRLLRGRRDADDVHEGRKSIKKIEALANLLDRIGAAPPRKDVKRLRAARQSLSKVRDADAIAETFEHLQSRFAGLISKRLSATIRVHLMRRKATIMKRARGRAGNLARTGKMLRKIRRSAKRWDVPSADRIDLTRVLKHSFRVSQKAMALAQQRGRPSDFHDWRKRVKNLWYQLRLAERLLPGLRSQIDGFGDLETALGEEHNLAVLRALLKQNRGLRSMRSQIDPLAAMSKVLRTETRRRALKLGGRLHKPSPREFVSALRRRLR